ncbi:hypothetical protein ACQPZZ_16770 [Microbispora sp. CA-135349]|uniref:hypothetical protein n=1 Tax=Microbispora sp. CA-135349 TaxID=3239953 RepID=UPI003D9259EF
MNKTIRRLAMPIIGTLLASSVVFASSSPAQAGGCTLWICGEAKNNSPWTIYTTEVLGTGGPHWCDVWNGGGGMTSSWWHTTCEQKPLAPGQSRGGGGVDVDAVTFADRDYVIKIDGTILGWRTRGVWTRIHSDQYVTCFKNSNGDPMCEVS